MKPVSATCDKVQIYPEYSMEKSIDRSKLSVEERRFVAQKFPHLIKQKEPTIDQLVVLFLKEHDVFVRPPDGTGRINDALAGAITGVYGIEAGATASIASNQNKIAAKQEWTSWKQWTLNHPDWKDFKTRALETIKEANTNAELGWNDPKVLKEVQDALNKRKEILKKHRKEQFVLISLLLGVAIVIYPVTLLVKSVLPETPPAKDKSINLYD